MKKMSDERKLDLKSRKEGLLMPNRSAYGRWMAGHFTIPLALLVAFLLTGVPWEALYKLDWYQNYLNIMSGVSINITKIPSTANPFPEYSMAFLGFINAAGPIYAIVGLYFGLKHFSKLKDIFPRKQISIAKLSGLLVGLGIATVILLWGAYFFSGESTIFPGRFYKSEWRFVGFFTLAWFVISAFCFGLASGTSKIFSRVKIRYSVPSFLISLFTCPFHRKRRI